MNIRLLFCLLFATPTLTLAQDKTPPNPQSPPLSPSTPTRVLFGATVAELPDSLRTKLGVLLTSDEGLGITTISRFGPAEEAGLRPSDILLKLDQTPINAKSSLILALQSYKPGDTIPITVLRMGQRKNLELTLGDQHAKPITPSQLVEARQSMPDNSTFDLIMRLKNAVIYQLSTSSPDIKRIKHDLCQMRSLMPTKVIHGEIPIYLTDSDGTFLIHGNEDRVLLEVIQDGNPSNTIYRIDTPGTQSPLPDDIKKRLQQMDR
ncbi:MAG: PDZ domain-containing protein [Akkermansia sp.]